MASDPQVSVVMSVYNNADTLRSALESILSQQGVPFEFVIIDDGSTDESPSLLEEAARRDTRIRLVCQENTGLTRALIHGCSLARAPWIARQDADDLSLPGRFAALMKRAASHPHAVLFASSTQFIGPVGELLHTMPCVDDPELARRQVRELGIGPPAHGAVMFSRAAYHAVGGYRACFYFGQDSDLWIRLAEHGAVVYEPGVYYAYRLSPGAISGSRRKYQKAFGRLGRACRDARRAGESEQPFLDEAVHLADEVRRLPRGGGSARDRWMSYYHIGSLLEPRDPVGAAGYYRKALAANPLAVRPRLKLLKQVLGK